MRVLLLHGDRRNPNEDGQGGGAETLCHDIIRCLGDAGHECEWWNGAEPIADAWARVQPDLTHVMTIHPYGSGIAPARWLLEEHLPVYWGLVDYWPFCGNRMMLVGRGVACPGVEGVCDHSCNEPQAEPVWLNLVNMATTATYNDYTAAIMRRHGVRVDHVMPIGIDTDLFAPEPAKRTPEPSIWTSCAWPEWASKGMHILQAAIQIEPKLTANLISHVPRARVAEGLKRAHIYVFPSTYEETWGLALHEAMASGCACIASDVAGAKGQITDGVDGVIVPKRDPVALRAAIDNLLRYPHVRERLGAAARQTALGRGLSQMAASLIEGYQLAISHATERYAHHSICG